MNLAKSYVEVSPWWPRLGIPIVCIDIAVQALLFSALSPTHYRGDAWGVGPLILVFPIIALGNLVALIHTPIAIFNWRHKGKGLAPVIFCLSVWVVPFVLFIVAK